MSSSIIRSQFANAEGTAAVIFTETAGPRFITIAGDVELWAQMLDAGTPDSMPGEADLAPAAVPASVTPRQARLALNQAGLLDDVDAAIAALPADQGKAARIEWEFAAAVKRDSPLVATLGNALGLTDAQLDALFVDAGGR